MEMHVVRRKITDKASLLQKKTEKLYMIGDT